ncbi:glycosyltransferase family 39 protein [Sphingobium sp. EM0848]|uniref:ArnT family glycosyltransferase n=1 Tax=Sphingobium sp. EM0848 TaxID=2743473 RepID=UPI00159C9390|nr:hypothetical protein [Sphingobium sp. EM0848]
MEFSGIPLADMAGQINPTLPLSHGRSSFPSSLARLSPLLLLLGCVAIAARIASCGNPLIQVDEQFYLLVARAMVQGQHLYVDIWDRKPIGLFLLYWPAALLPAQAAIIAYQAMATAFVIGTALAIRQIARQAGWTSGATAAAIFYILWLNVADGQGGQSPVFYNLLMAGAVLAILRTIRASPGNRQRRNAGLGAMALVGVAIQIKYNVLFEGMLFGLWLCYEEWRAHRRLKPVIGLGLSLIGIALAPTIAAGLYYLAIGHFPEFFFANFVSIFHRSGSVPDLGHNAIILTLILAPGIALAFWPVPRDTSSASADRQVRTALFLRLWLIVAVMAVVLFGTYFEHYGLPVMLPAACCSARFLGSYRRIGASFLILLAIGGQFVIYQNDRRFGTGRTLQPIVDTIGKGSGRLYVYSGPPALYLLTGRPPASPWAFPDHLMRITEAQAVGVDTAKEVDRILASRPEWIVTMPLKNGESLPIRAKIYRAVDRDYHAVGDFPLGRRPLTLFRRNGANG